MRKNISKKTRFDVFKRDGFICQYCGSHPPAVILEADHIDPSSLGGSDDMDNLVTACFNCNRGKAATPLTVVPQSLEERAMETAEREAQVIGYQKIMESRRRRIEREAWRVANIWIERFITDGIHRDHFESIKRFNDQLGVHSVMDAMDLAVAKTYHKTSAFKYFCGVCWRRIRGA